MYRLQLVLEIAQRQYLQHSKAQQCSESQGHVKRAGATWHGPSHALQRNGRLPRSRHCSCCKGGNFGRDHDTSLCLIVFVYVCMNRIVLACFGCIYVFWVVIRWHGYLVVAIGCLGCLWPYSKVAVTWEYHRSLCHKMPHGPCCTSMSVCAWVLFRCQVKVKLAKEKAREKLLGAVFILQRGHHFQEEDGRDHSNRSASTLPDHFQAASIRTDTDRHRQWMGFSMVVERPNIVEVRRNPCSTESEYLQEITCSALRKWRMMKMTWFQTCRLQTPLFSRDCCLQTSARPLAEWDLRHLRTSTNIYEHLRTSTNIYEHEHLRTRTTPQVPSTWLTLPMAQPGRWASTKSSCAALEYCTGWLGHARKHPRQTGRFLFSERVRMSRIKKYRWRFDESMKQIHGSTENPLCLRVNCWGNCMAYGEVSQQGHQRVIFCLQRSSASKEGKRFFVGYWI